MNKKVCLGLVLIGMLSVQPGWAGSEGLGEALTVAIPLAALGASAFNHDLTGGYQLGGALAATAVATYGLNLAIDKKTPEGEEGAFPSGHSAVSFAGATYLQRRYGWRYGLPAYGAAAVVGWSRINADRHDAVDVLGGAVLGSGLAFLLTDRQDPVAVAPWLDSQGRVAGVQVSTPWQ